MRYSTMQYTVRHSTAGGRHGIVRNELPNALYCPLGARIAYACASAFVRGRMQVIGRPQRPRPALREHAS